jgi:hypothetical protein
VAAIFFSLLFGAETTLRLFCLHPRRYFAARGAGIDAALALASFLLVIPQQVLMTC